MKEDKSTIAKRNRRRGKRIQKKGAELLGARNIGILGGEDCEHPIWSIEVKSRKVFSGDKFMLQAEMNAKDGKTPLVLVHMMGKRHGQDIVMLRLKDFQEWFGKVVIDDMNKFELQQGTVTTECNNVKINSVTFHPDDQNNVVIDENKLGKVKVVDREPSFVDLLVYEVDKKIMGYLDDQETQN